MRGSPYLHLALFVGAVVLYRLVFVSGLADQDLYNTWLFNALLVTGFYFVFGLSGQFAFSQAAFAGVGGYASAWAVREEAFGTDIAWVGVVFGGFVTGVLAAGFVLFVRRASHFYFAIATLGLSAIVLDVLHRWTEFTGAVGDATTGIPPLSILGFEFDSSYRVFWLLLGALALALVAGIWIERSPVQREVIAERDQETVAATLGIPTLRLRVTMFVLGSTIAGLAGALLVHWRGSVAPDDFGIELGLGIFVMLILGGIDSRWGAVLGAAFYVFVPRWLEDVDAQFLGRDLRAYREILFGSLLVVTMVAFPEGLVGIARRARRLVAKRTARDKEEAGEEVEAPPRAAASQAPDTLAPPVVHASPVLEAEDVRVRFGGVAAVDGVSLALRADEILGLVGPNGSGKTTFLNALTGVVPATGTLRVDGQPLRMGHPGRARPRGMVRTYQAPQTYHHLTCLEDVLLSTPDRGLTGVTAAWLRRPAVLRRERDRWRAAADALARVQLEHLAEVPTGRLSYGQRRLLEVARAVAARPRILLLDEPSAGLDASETDVLAGHLRRLRAEGVAVLVVDHKLDFLTHLCDRIAVLELGRLVAVGDAGTVFADQRVVDAYLGVPEEV
jgi:branched-chain amino acid transport system permease protein